MILSLSLLIQPAAWAKDSEEFFEAGSLASEGVLYGHTASYLKLQSEYQLQPDYGKGQTEGIRTLPNRKRCLEVLRIDKAHTTHEQN